jgi:hypothetical protein
LNPNIENLSNRTEIPFNRFKIILLLIGALAFVAIGIWFIIEPETLISEYGRRRYLQNPDIIRLLGIACTLFFGTAGFYITRKLFNKKIGLIIDSTGITDNSNALDFGLIEWNDILEIRTKKINSSKFLLIDIVDPEKYILKAKSTIQTKLMRGHMNMNETLISISSNTLKINFEELEKLIQSEFKKNKNAR